MLPGVTLVYKFVVHCYKTLLPWDYPWFFGMEGDLGQNSEMDRTLKEIGRNIYNRLRFLNKYLMF